MELAGGAILSSLTSNDERRKITALCVLMREVTTGCTGLALMMPLVVQRCIAPTNLTEKKQNSAPVLLMRRLAYMLLRSCPVYGTTWVTVANTIDRDVQAASSTGVHSPTIAELGVVALRTITALPYSHVEEYVRSRWELLIATIQLSRNISLRMAAIDALIVYAAPPSGMEQNEKNALLEKIVVKPRFAELLRRLLTDPDDGVSVKAFELLAVFQQNCLTDISAPTLLIHPTLASTLSALGLTPTVCQELVSRVIKMSLEQQLATLPSVVSICLAMPPDTASSLLMSIADTVLLPTLNYDWNPSAVVTTAACLMSTVRHQKGLLLSVFPHLTLCCEKLVVATKQRQKAEMTSKILHLFQGTNVTSDLNACDEHVYLECLRSLLSVLPTSYRVRHSVNLMEGCSFTSLITVLAAENTQSSHQPTSYISDASAAPSSALLRRGADLITKYVLKKMAHDPGSLTSQLKMLIASSVADLFWELCSDPAQVGPEINGAGGVARTLKPVLRQCAALHEESVNADLGGDLSSSQSVLELVFMAISTHIYGHLLPCAADRSTLLTQVGYTLFQANNSLLDSVLELCSGNLDASAALASFPALQSLFFLSTEVLVLLHQHPENESMASVAAALEGAVDAVLRAIESTSLPWLLMQAEAEKTVAQKVINEEEEPNKKHTSRRLQLAKLISFLARANWSFSMVAAPLANKKPSDLLCSTAVTIGQVVLLPGLREVPATDTIPGFNPFFFTIDDLTPAQRVATIDATFIRYSRSAEMRRGGNLDELSLTMQALAMLCEARMVEEGEFDIVQGFVQSVVGLWEHHLKVTAAKGQDLSIVQRQQLQFIDTLLQFTAPYSADSIASTWLPQLTSPIPPAPCMSPSGKFLSPASVWGEATNVVRSRSSMVSHVATSASDPLHITLHCSPVPVESATRSAIEVCAIVVNKTSTTLDEVCLELGSANPLVRVDIGRAFGTSVTNNPSVRNYGSVEEDDILVTATATVRRSIQTDAPRIFVRGEPRRSLYLSSSPMDAVAPSGTAHITHCGGGKFVLHPLGPHGRAILCVTYSLLAPEGADGDEDIKVFDLDAITVEITRRTGLYGRLVAESMMATPTAITVTAHVTASAKGHGSHTAQGDDLFAVAAAEEESEEDEEDAATLKGTTTLFLQTTPFVPHLSLLLGPLTEHLISPMAARHMLWHLRKTGRITATRHVVVEENTAEPVIPNDFAHLFSVSPATTENSDQVYLARVSLQTPQHEVSSQFTSLLEACHWICVSVPADNKKLFVEATSPYWLLAVLQLGEFWKCLAGMVEARKK